MSDLKRKLRCLRCDRRGVTIIEFAFGFPFVLFLGLYGLELSNLAIMNLRVSQVALNLADNASRVGVDTGLPTLDLREVDINDVLTGAQKQGAPFKLTERGRITVSTLYHDGTNQRIHWQRCLGMKKGPGWDSSYGTATITDGSDATPANRGRLRPEGMGPAGQVVHAPPGSGVIFVEINYDYEPLIDTTWIGTNATKLHYTASFIVRDRRNYSQIFNPAPAAKRYTCNLYTTK